MEIILREDVPNLGHTGDIVKVKPGFARNYLLPRGLAVVADRRNMHELEHQKRVLAEKRERERQASQSQAENLNQVRLTMKARAGEGGKLFGSVTNLDIEKGLLEKGFSVDRRRIRLDEPIKLLGEHRVTIRLAAGVDATVTVTVEADGPLAAEEAESKTESATKATETLNETA
jgi:large subunit ribosomal protein L9